MAQHIPAKAATEVVTYRWTVPLAADDTAASVAHSAAGVTVDSAELDGGEVALTLSGGMAGATGSVALTITTDLGDTLTETLYVPIVADAATGMTARDVCEFALRKVYGKDETPEASALADAMERLNDMLRSWAATGADVGATFPLEAGTVIYCKPEFEAAIKNNLIVQIADLYDLPIGQIVQINAVRGLQLVKSANLPDQRTGAAYY